jgi:hypothetical protein
MEVLKEKKGFRLEAYQMKDVINSLHNTYSFVIRSLDKALEEFRAA